MTDEQLLTESVEILEHVGCQFWACEGPTLEPIEMTTCGRCLTLARLRQRLGLPVVHEEETRPYQDAIELRRYVVQDCHRSMTLEQAKTRIRNRDLIAAYGTDER
jgi:hypothetical protein